MIKFIIGIALAVCVTNLTAQERPTKDEVMEYFKITNALEVFEGYSESYINVLKQSYPQLETSFYEDPEFKELMGEYTEKLISKSVLIMQNNMSKKDLAEVLELLKTESGQKLLKLNKSMIPLFNEVGTKTNVWLNQSVANIMKKHDAEKRKVQ